MNIESILTSMLEGKSEVEQIQIINNIKTILHKLSPFADEPVDCVIWVNQKPKHKIKPGINIKQGINNYGMELIDVNCPL